MNDLISRAAVIEYLMNNMGWHDEDGYEVDDADEKRTIITDLVNGISTIDAIPMEWLNERHRKCCEDEDTDLMDAITVLCNEYYVWQQEQEEG